MVAQFEIRDRVLEFVEMAACSPIKGFYPTAVAKYVNTSVEIIFPYLLDLVKTEEILIKWEIRCPEFYCHRIVKELDSLDSLDDEELDCICGNDFELKEQDIYPRFDLNPSYKQYLRGKNENKKNSKKKQVLSLQH